MEADRSELIEEEARRRRESRAFESLSDDRRLELLMPELRNWQKFASYCRSCALSGESDPQDFCDFMRTIEAT